MEYIILGKAINTHGVKGEIKVELYTDFKEERFKTDSKIYFGEDYIEETVKSFRMHNGFMLLTLKDKEDINLIEKYKGYIIYKSKEDIKPLEDGYYFRDLIGLDVWQNGKKVGYIKYLEEGTKNNYMRVIKEDKKEVLVPFLPVFIKNVDLDNKKVEIVEMEGLL